MKGFFSHMRLDKFLCQRNQGTRSQVKELIRRGQVTVNGNPVKKADYSVEEDRDRVCVQGREVTGEKYVYYMLNKPKGVVSAVRDNTAGTVVELLRPEDRRRDIFPAGRLDKDTEGLLLLTNDGGLAHKLLSPRNHVEKTYLVTPRQPLGEQEICQLEQGVEIGEERPTLSAKARKLEDGRILLTIHEGKFHQVKRMLQAVGNGVDELKRTSFGGIALDDSLQPGEYRPLTEEELGRLREAVGREIAAEIAADGKE
ncbi:MAG: rRNA pseudouridine synthase [Roseburia sp.]|nr:rRNA pseudouridine synthase [Roseburia sp.]MCM1098825.1 rRNA pseudouridine synthase [Ruminococcus flavefaciens]